MSSAENPTNSAGTSASSPEKRRSTVPDILPQQRSFEKRYSHIIHKQILETSINKEALQRQINAFFSCGRSASLQHEVGMEMKSEKNDGHNEKNDVVVEEVDVLEAVVENAIVSNADKAENDLFEEVESTGAEKVITRTKKTLEKLATLDIAEKSELEDSQEKNEN